MRTEYLEEFIAFSRHLSFSETAEELFIAKSTLSTHIANLERELGLKLIDRDNDNALTQEGALFLDGAKSALETLEGTVARCTRFREEAAGRVRIACLTPTASLASLLSERLDVPFQFVDREFREQPFAPLDTNRADIALLCDFSYFPRLVDEALARGLAYRPARPFPAVIAMMASHPLAAKRQLSRDDLVGASIMTESMLAYEHDRILIDRMLGADLHLSYAPRQHAGFSDLLIADFGTALSHAQGDGQPVLCTARRRRPGGPARRRAVRIPARRGVAGRCGPPGDKRGRDDPRLPEGARTAREPGTARPRHQGGQLRECYPAW